MMTVMSTGEEAFTGEGKRDGDLVGRRCNVRIIKTQTGNMMHLMNSINIIIYLRKFFSIFFLAKYTYFSKYRVIAQSRVTMFSRSSTLLKIETSL